MLIVYFIHNKIEKYLVSIYNHTVEKPLNIEFILIILKHYCQ